MEPQQAETQREPLLEDLRAMKSWITLFIVALSWPWEMLLRRNFGERYVNLGTILLPGFILAFSIGVSTDVPDASALFLMIYGTAFVLMCCWHKVVIWKRNRRGEEWYSYSNGESRLFWNRLGIGDMTASQYIEPILGMVLGVLLTPVAKVFGAFLFFSGFAMGLKEARIRLSLIHI